MTTPPLPRGRLTETNAFQSRMGKTVVAWESGDLLHLPFSLKLHIITPAILFWCHVQPLGEDAML